MLALVCVSCSVDSKTLSAISGPDASAGGANGGSPTGGAATTGGVSATTGGTTGAGGTIEAATGGTSSGGAGGNTTAADGGSSGGSGGTKPPGSGSSPGVVDASTRDGALADGDTDSGRGLTAIQSVKDGTVGLNTTITVDHVFVTATKQTASGAFDIAVQEPEGATFGGHAYPEYAGVIAFLPKAYVGTIPSIGDCIDVTGATSSFHSETQIAAKSATAASNCGTFPRPFAIPSASVAFADVATDTDLVTTGDQAGALANRYDAVLVRFDDVVVSAAPAANGSFSVTTQANPAGPTLFVSAFFVTETTTASQAYASIAGIFQLFDTYALAPRSDSDFIR